MLVRRFIFAVASQTRRKSTVVKLARFHSQGSTSEPKQKRTVAQPRPTPLSLGALGKPSLPRAHPQWKAPSPIGPVLLASSEVGTTRKPGDVRCGVCWCRPLLGRMTLLNESLERVVPVCVSEGVRLKKLGATVRKNRPVLGIQRLCRGSSLDRSYPRCHRTFRRGFVGSEVGGARCNAGGGLGI